MNDDAALLTIGEIARMCGLSISALRFYDRQGILSPAQVDAATGYRWYAPSQVSDARLLARLRGIGLPLPEISTILARDDTVVRDGILADHISRLEASLAAAREQVSQLSGGGGDLESSVTEPSDAEDSAALLSAADLAAGIRIVRHAVGDDPEWPAIHGIYLVAMSRGLRLSATDRHRAAFAEVAAQSTGRLRGLLATADAEALLACAEQNPSGQVKLQTGSVELTDSRGERLFESQLLDAQFPDLSHAIPVVRDSVVISTEELAEVLAEAENSYEEASTELNVVPVPAAGASSPVIQLNRVYLEDALAGLTGRQGSRESTAEQGHPVHGHRTQRHPAKGQPVQLRFDFDGPADPVAIRRAEDLGTFAVVLPVIPDSHR